MESLIASGYVETGSFFRKEALTCSLLVLFVEHPEPHWVFYAVDKIGSSVTHKVPGELLSLEAIAACECRIEKALVALKGQ